MGNCMVVKQETFDRAQKNMMNLPSFCAVYQDETGPVDEATAKLVADTWATCMAGTAEPYLEARRVTPSITPLVFFYNTYYNHLFEMAPEIRPLFTRSIMSQGRMLANMIKSVVVNIAQDYNLFRLSLEAMARNHNKMGIKSEYYALSGLVLFLTIRVCLGEKLYTEEIRIAWTRLYARMMQIIIPVVVSNAMPGEESKEDYFMKVIKVQNTEGERDGKSVTRTPPSLEKGGDGASINAALDNVSDQLAHLGDSLVIELKRKLLAATPSLVLDRTYKGTEYKQVMIGSEVIDWLIVNKCADTRPNAVRMASQLWSVGLRHVHEHDSLLDDYSFYYWLPEQSASDTLSSAELSELKISIIEAKLCESRTYKLVTHPNSLIASSLVDWLVHTKRASDRHTAVNIARQLQNAGLRSCDGHLPFDDSYQLFTFDAIRVSAPTGAPSSKISSSNSNSHISGGHSSSGSGSGVTGSRPTQFSGKSGSITPTTPLTPTGIPLTPNAANLLASTNSNANPTTTTTITSSRTTAFFPSNAPAPVAAAAAVCPFDHTSGSVAATADFSLTTAAVLPGTVPLGGSEDGGQLLSITTAASSHAVHAVHAVVVTPLIS